MKSQTVPQRSVRVAASLALVLLAVGGCASSDEESTTTPPPPVVTQTETLDSSALEQWINDVGQAWLTDFSATGTPLCPATPEGNTVVRASEGSVSACLVGAPGNLAVRVENLTDVPMTVWGNPATNVFTVAPRSSLDVHLVDPGFGQELYYRPDTAAGLTLAVADTLQGVLDNARTGGQGWLLCDQGPAADCIVDALIEALPSRVTILGRTVPIEAVATALNTAFQSSDLIRAYAGSWTGSQPGTLTLVER